MLTFSMRMELRKILNSWDPLRVIGKNSQDAYDAYMVRVYQSLVKGTSVEDVSKMLTGFVVVDMGRKSNPAEDMETAQKIMKWFRTTIQ